MGEKPPKDPFFHCKEFKVRHDTAALKVTTEALIFGGYLAQKQLNKESCWLEIGTGCGILPMMIAQKNKYIIDTVEINKKAFEIAYDNVQNSKFKHQIGVYHCDIQHFGNNSTIEEFDKYDLIFTNPPFYKNHLKGKIEAKNLAKHNDSLPFDMLASQIERLITKTGIFMVLLPPFELGILENELNKIRLFKNEEICIHPTQNSKILRIIATFAQEKSTIKKTDFIIKNLENEYTSQFKELLKDYYLIF